MVIKQPQGLYPDPDVVAAFRREHDILELAAGPRVIRALDHTTHDGRVWLVLEDFGGRSLTELFQRKRPGITHAIEIARRVVEALADVHRLDIVHKNISPASIWMNPETGELKLIDFSIASTVAREVPRRNDPSLAGNLLYMAPEQTGRMNRVVDYRADFYGVGAVLYELLTGKPPFASGDPLDLVHAHIARQPSPPQSVREEIPTELSDLVLTLLAKRAENRYQSAEGLLHDLGECARIVAGETPETYAPRTRDLEHRFRIPEVLYGRDAEVAALTAATERIASGTIEMLLVAGRPGIGKTTLVQEIRLPAASLNANVISGKFDQVHRGLPYASLIQAFRQFIRHVLAGSAEDVERWGQRIGEAVGSSGRALTNLIGELELVIGPQPELSDVPPTEAENRLRVVFQRFVRALAAPEHPLVLFVDDLQWADLPSMRLLEALAVDPDAQHILLIGAYRDNEVTPSGPLLRTLDTVRSEGARVGTITLGPLTQANVVSLIVDTLQCSAREARPLAKAIVRKTYGNPFYLARFLEGLYTDGLLRVDGEGGAWTWDLPEIERLSVTENVVDFMSKQLRRLAPDAQRVLQLGACAGVSFGLHTVAALTGTSRRQAQTDLQVALQRNLIHPLDATYWIGDDDADIPDFRYAFAHDRVQQAAHEALAPADRSAAHLAIGRLMRERLSEAQQLRRLFEMVEHFSLGAEGIDDAAERDDIADLCLHAGRKALDSAAYDAAHRYLSQGVTLADKASWERRYSETLELYVAAAEAAYLAGEDQAMAAWVDAVGAHARDRLDRMRAEEIVVYGLIRRNELVAAVEKALVLLEELGVDLPRAPSQEDLQAKVGEVLQRLAEYDVAAIGALEDLDDPVVDAARKLLTGVASAAYLTVPTLFPMIAIELVQSTLSHGVSRESPYGFALVALVLSSVKMVPLADANAQIAQKMLERWDDRALRVRPTHVIQSMVRPWTGPLEDTLPPLLQNYADGVDTGDLEYSFWSAHQYCYHLFYAAMPLGRGDSEIQGMMRAMAHHKQLPQLAVTLPFAQLVANLRGRAADPSRLVSPGFDEERVLATHMASDFRGAVFVINTCMLIARVYFRDWEGANQVYQGTQDYADSAPGTVHVASTVYFGAIARLSQTHPDATTIANVEASRDELAQWAEFNPHHYKPWLCLVNAELARVKGDLGSAMQSYDQAIAAARSSGLLGDEAFANERAGLFHLERGSRTSGRAYLLEARYAYQRWGATAKVEHLTEAHADLRLDDATTASPGAVDIDFLSLLRASHALAGELRLDTLLGRVIEVGMQAAGATRGFLLTEQQGRWIIEIGLDANGDELVPRKTPVSGCGELAGTVVQYVGRTGEQLVLAEASSDRRFSADPYLKQVGLASILCTPAVHKGRRNGMIYLENHLVSGGFTPARLETAQVLASQAAISMENAALVDNLEAEVAQRTVAMRASLAQTQATLTHMAEGLVAIDTKGMVQAANPAFTQLLGTPVEVGSRATAVLPDKIAALLDQSIDLDAPARAEVSLPGDRIAAAVASPIHAVDRGEAIGAVVILRDITLMKEVDRMKSEFTSTVAHELRTPMTSVIGFIKLTRRTFERRLKAQLPDDPRTVKAADQVSENLEIVIEEGERLTALIANMLDLTKIESGRMTWQKDHLDPASLVQRACHATAALFVDRSVSLEHAAKDNLPRLHGDADWLQQVLVNLISNAAKFTAEGTVKVTAAKEGKHIRFEVTDTGSGIPADQTARVFEKFAQIGGEDAPKGTGLGLPISREIVEAHGGAIGCESALGAGSTFWFRLPISA